MATDMSQIDPMDFSIRNQVSEEDLEESPELSLGTGSLNDSKREVELKASLKNDSTSRRKKDGSVPGGVFKEATPTSCMEDGKVHPRGVSTKLESEKGFVSRSRDEVSCKVIEQLLDRMRIPIQLQMMMSFLMVAGEEEGEQRGLPCLDESKQEVVNPERDSGIHSGISNQGGQLLNTVPAATQAVASGGKNLPDLEGILDQEVQLDGNSEESKGSEDEIEQRVGDGFEQAPATGRHIPHSLQTKVSHTPSKDLDRKVSITQRFDKITHKSLPQATNKPEYEGTYEVVDIKESLRAISMYESSRQGKVKYGTKEDMLNMVMNIGLETVSEDSGVFLKKYASIFESHGVKNYFKNRTDYKWMTTFQEGKDVYLNRSCLTGKMFVTKWVPLVEEVLRSGRRTQVLQRRQQVELVLVHQDSCPWNGLAAIYGVVKRKHRGRDWAELFMEYCEGNTLLNQKNLLSEIDDENFLKFTEKFVEIFNYLHNNDIVHGDNKVENAGYRFDGPALFDFEAAKHPRYKMNNRGTFQCLPYWFRQCFQRGVYNDLLKTIDLWGIGVIFLRIRYNTIVYGRELFYLRSCDTCEGGVCSHLKNRFLTQIQASPGLVNAYLPSFRGSPAERTLVSLIHGFLTSGGHSTQFTSQDALDILQEGCIAVHIMMDGIQVIKPIIIPKGTKMKDFIKSKHLDELKAQPKFVQGFWLSADGAKNVDLNQTLTDCCLLHILPTVPTVDN